MWGVVTEDGLIVEMPGRLPAAADAFDIVGPGDTLNERILVLVVL